MTYIYRCISNEEVNFITSSGIRRRRPRKKLGIILIFVSFGAGCDVLASHSYFLGSPSDIMRFYSLRGGTAEINDADQDSTQSKAGMVVTSVPRDRKQRKRSFLWPDLFELADDIKAEVSSGTDIDVLSSAGSFDSGRGGALVKEKPKRFPRWLGPLDVSRVAPLAFRLLKDGLSSETANESIDNLSDRNAIDGSTVGYAKNIWVNTWVGNLPDDESNSLERDEENSLRTIQSTEKRDPDELHVENEISSDYRVNKSTSTNEELESSTEESNSEEADFLVELNTEVTEVISDIGTNATAIEPGIEPSSDDSYQSSPESLETTSKLAIEPENLFLSSGYWGTIDNMLTLGYSSTHPDWRISCQLRSVRKVAAKVTGLHGLVSGKYRSAEPSEAVDSDVIKQSTLMQRRLEAIDRAKENLERLSAVATARKRKRPFFWIKTSERFLPVDIESITHEKTEKETAEVRRRLKRVQEIDRQMQESQNRLFELACEKDVLQKRPNPLWNYTIDNLPERSKSKEVGEMDVSENLVLASRLFNFPPQDLVDDYLEMLFSTGRIVKMNHTDLWQKLADEDDDEDELASPTLYAPKIGQKRSSGYDESKSGSWFLRNGLGEKIGETAESSAYKAVCQSVMQVLARSLSALHGVNVMGFSDIRLYMEQTPNLPPLPVSGRSSNYAQETIHDVVRRGARRSSKMRSNKRRSADDYFIQRDAVVETLLSQCQIAAPLLKLFPLNWQRALIANLVTLITAVMADFCEGLEFQILGHRLSFSFLPITEDDMLRGLVHDNFKSQRRTNPAQFEASVLATAADVGTNLKFLDRWHERALGGDVLRTQIATLIARLVLTLVDDILHGAKISLWAAHAGGPRLTAGLEYRTSPNNINDV